MDDWQLDAENVLQTRDGFVADRLRQAIQQGYFEPGQKLDQHEIASLLNVSRSPVREALRTLAAEGLVKVYPHRGAVVAVLSLRELEEIFLVRAVLEGLGARLGAPKIDEERIDKLRSTLEQLNKTSDLDDWLRLNREFHHTIYQADHRPRLLSLIQRLRSIAAPYIRQYITSPEHLEAAQIGHQRIFEACLNRDGFLAEKETRQHLEGVGKGAVAFVESISTASPETD